MTPNESNNNLARGKKRDFSNGPVWDEKLKRWLVEITHDGKREKAKRFRRQNQAWGYWNECQESIRNGTWGSRQSQLSKKTTFLEAKTLYLEFKRNTRAFPAVITHLKPFSQVFDNECLSKITKDRIIEIVNRRLDKGLKKSAVDTDLAWLMAFYNWLERTEKYLNNPTKGIKLFRENDERVIYLVPYWMKKNPLADQFHRLVEACKKGPWFLTDIVVIATFTGLRRGNVRQLSWSWMDLNSRTLRIPTTRSKGKKSITIPMDSLPQTEPIVYETLRRLYETRNNRIQSEYVFPQIEGANAGAAISASELQSAWHRARTESGIEKDFRESNNDSFHFHDLRHTFASWHVMRGTDLYVVMRLMGHGNIDQTQRYAHLAPDYLQSSGLGKCDELFPKMLPNTTITASKPRTTAATGDQLAFGF